MSLALEQAEAQNDAAMEAGGVPRGSKPGILLRLAFRAGWRMCLQSLAEDSVPAVMGTPTGDHVRCAAKCDGKRCVRSVGHNGAHWGRVA